MIVAVEKSLIDLTAGGRSEVHAEPASGSSAPPARLPGVAARPVSGRSSTDLTRGIAQLPAAQQ
jgi:hypothetical protein